jgi:lysophospholipase L1-like esterase
MPLDAATPITQSWFWLAGVDVMAREQSGAIVVLGDSTTDGDRSTVGANHRWPDQVAKRILAHRNPSRLGVVNEGLVHGHPTDEGYRAMADAIDLNLFSNGDRR